MSREIKSIQIGEFISSRSKTGKPRPLYGDYRGWKNDRHDPNAGMLFVGYPPITDPNAYTMRKLGEQQRGLRGDDELVIPLSREAYEDDHGHTHLRWAHRTHLGTFIMR